MKKLGLSLLAALFVSAAAMPSMAAKKARKAAAPKAEKPRGPAPVAKAEAISDIRGDYKWGMKAQDVINIINGRIQASYKDKLAASAADPARNDKLQKQMREETSKTGKNMVKFDGQKGPWDVSIVDQEIVQSQGMSMLLVKESKSTRYFFFANDSLFKMFIAFDKEMLAGKGFKEFGDLMQIKFGKAQEVWVNQSYLGVKERKLDHLLWRSSTGDSLKLVDRSEFYDVFCLVLADASVDGRLMAARREAEANQPRGDILDSIMTNKPSDRDENDNVIDRITGQNILKPGERRGGEQNIKVPSPTQPSKTQDPLE